MNRNWNPDSSLDHERVEKLLANSVNLTQKMLEKRETSWTIKLSDEREARKVDVKLLERLVAGLEKEIGQLKKQNEQFSDMLRVIWVAQGAELPHDFPK